MGSCPFLCLRCGRRYGMSRVSFSPLVCRRLSYSVMFDLGGGCTRFTFLLKVKVKDVNKLDDIIATRGCVCVCVWIRASAINNQYISACILSEGIQWWTDNYSGVCECVRISWHCSSNKTSISLLMPDITRIQNRSIESAAETRHGVYSGKQYHSFKSPTYSRLSVTTSATVLIAGGSLPCTEAGMKMAAGVFSQRGFLDLHLESEVFPVKA